MVIEPIDLLPVCVRAGFHTLTIGILTATVHRLSEAPPSAGSENTAVSRLLLSGTAPLPPTSLPSASLPPFECLLLHFSRFVSSPLLFSSYVFLFHISHLHDLGRLWVKLSPVQLSPLLESCVSRHVTNAGT